MSQYTVYLDDINRFLTVEADNENEARSLAAQNVNERRKAKGRSDTVSASDFKIKEQPQEQSTASKIGMGALGFAFPMTKELVESGAPGYQTASTAFIEGVGNALPFAGGKIISLASRVPQIANVVERAPALSRGIVEGAGMLGSLQAAGAVSGQDVSPVAMASAFGVPAAMGGAPMLGRYLQKDLAPKVAFYSYKPPKGDVTPDFERMYSEGNVPYFGGHEGTLARVEKKLAPLNQAAQKEVQTAQEQGKRVDVETVFDDAKSEILNLVKDGKVSKTEAQRVLSMFRRELNAETVGTADIQGGRVSTFNQEYGAETYETPMELGVAWKRKTAAQKEADKAGAYKTSEQTAKGTRLAKETEAKSWNSVIEQVSPELRQIMREMAPYQNFKGVVENRASVGSSNAPIMGFRDMVANAMLGPLGFVANKAISTAGGGAMLYDIGRAMANRGAGQSGGVLLSSRAFPWLANNQER